MERCQESPRRANSQQTLPVRELMGCVCLQPRGGTEWELCTSKEPPDTMGEPWAGQAGRVQPRQDCGEVLLKLDEFCHFFSDGKEKGIIEGTTGGEICGKEAVGHAPSLQKPWPRSPASPGQA